MTTPTKRTCPRCEGCDHDEPHHWMEDGNTLTGLACKHCPAIAVECCGCAGGGVHEEEDESGVGHDVPCGYCGGAGIVEVVKITRDEVERMRWMIKAGNADIIKATLEIWPIDGEAIEDVIGDAIRRAIPESDPITIGVAYTGFKLTGSYYSVETPAELAGLYLRAMDGRRVEPLTINMEFPRKENA